MRFNNRFHLSFFVTINFSSDDNSFLDGSTTPQGFIAGGGTHLGGNYMGAGGTQSINPPGTGHQSPGTRHQSVSPGTSELGTGLPGTGQPGTGQSITGQPPPGCQALVNQAPGNQSPVI